GAECLPPERVSEHDDAIGTWTILAVTQRATEHGTDAEQRKEIGRRFDGGHPRRRAGRVGGTTRAQQTHVALEAVAGDAVERSGVLAELYEDGLRRRIHRPDPHKPVGVAIWKRFEQHRVDDTEDGAEI